MHSGLRSVLRPAVFLLAAGLLGLTLVPAAAEGSPPIVVAQAAPDPAAAEKEAFDAAKELGTAEAWQAFLKSYPTGFRADLARAYVSKLSADQAGKASAGTPSVPPPPPQGVTPPVQTVVAPPVAPNLGLIDLGPGATPWQNGTVELDDSDKKTYVAYVAGPGMELLAYCTPAEIRGGTQGLGLLLRENPHGVYPEFDTRLEQGLAATPDFPGGFKQVALRFQGGAVYGATARVFGMTGELELSQAGQPVPVSSPLVESLMGGSALTVLAPPFSGTFQLTSSRKPICSVLAACGAKVAGCKGVSTPTVNLKKVQPIAPPVAYVPIAPGYVPPKGTGATQGVSQQKQFVPGQAQGGGTALVIEGVGPSGPCPDTKNQVRNSAGQCVCNALTTLVGGKCLKACVGATRDQNGNCQCPAGQINPYGYCVDTTDQASLNKTVKAGEGTTCPDGRLRDVSGACLGWCSGERLWDGKKCITSKEAKNYYCRDLGIPEKAAEDGSCKAAPSGGLTVKLVPGAGTKNQGNGVPIFQLFGLPGGITLPQGGTTQQKIVCTGGQVPQTDGKCACPSGQQLDGGKCTTKFKFTGNAKITPDPNANPFGAFTATKQVACTGGAQTGADGKCTCPSGQSYDGKTCVVDKVVRAQDATGVTTQKITCTGGQLPQKDGSCACTGGQAVVNGKCPGTLGGTFTQTKTTITCTGGQIPSNGGCACPGGQQFTGGKCVAPGGQQGTIPGLPSGFNPLFNLSDRRAKTNVSEVATLPDGIRLYAFRYLTDETMRVGVMAQDLLADAHMRAAVHAVDGLYRVDYAALGLRMATLAEWRERGMEAVLLH